MLTPLLTPDQVAEYLGVSVKTVHGFVREGRLGCIQLSPRDRRFTEAQISEFLAGRTIEPPKKSVDSGTLNRLPSPAKSRQGGQKGSVGESVRAQLREEMRQW